MSHVSCIVDQIDDQSYITKKNESAIYIGIEWSRSQICEGNQLVCRFEWWWHKNSHSNLWSCLVLLGPRHSFLIGGSNILLGPYSVEDRIFARKTKILVEFSSAKIYFYSCLGIWQEKTRSNQTCASTFFQSHVQMSSNKYIPTDLLLSLK
jgi:hypothetical protein